jgi:hypothetical protein
MHVGFFDNTDSFSKTAIPIQFEMPIGNKRILNWPIIHNISDRMLKLSKQIKCLVSFLPINKC